MTSIPLAYFHPLRRGRNWIFFWIVPIPSGPTVSDTQSAVRCCSMLSFF
jgi:hypothetical protein